MIGQRISFAIALASAGALGATLATLDAAGSPTECTVTAVQAKAPKGTTITSAIVVEAGAGVPRYCNVDRHVSVPRNEVNVRLGLPETWNGKYYFVGVGGLGGTIGNLNAALTR